MNLLQKLLGVLSVALVLGLVFMPTPLAAQTTLTSFDVERALALSDILTTISPQVPANVLAGLAGGALEIRELLIYNPATNAVTSTIFLVPTGSPIPTPVGTIQPSSVIATFVLGVDKIYVSTTSVLFVGTITTSTATPYGSYQGATGVISAGLTPCTAPCTTPPAISNVVDVIAGAVVDWSAAGAGTVVVTTPPPPPTGGTGGTGPTVVINGPTQALTREITLDASQSTDPSGSALTYAWTLVSPPNGATILNPTTSITGVQILEGFNNYVFQVVVTNAAGVSSMGTITVQFIGH